MLHEGKVWKSWTVQGESKKPVVKVGVPDRPDQEGIITFRVQVLTDNRRSRRPSGSGVWRSSGNCAPPMPRSAISAIRRRGLSKGVALTIEGRYEEALEAIGQATALDPEDATKWIKHGQTLAELNRHEDAIASFDKAPRHQSEASGGLGQQGRRPGEAPAPRRIAHGAGGT